MENLKTIRDISIMKDPIKEYGDCTIHIALERCDTNKDWRVFKYLSLDRKWLLHHLKMTQPIFDYYVYKLSKNEQDNILL